MFSVVAAAFCGNENRALHNNRQQSIILQNCTNATLEVDVHLAKYLFSLLIKLTMETKQCTVLHQYSKHLCYTFLILHFQSTLYINKH